MDPKGEREKICTSCRNITWVGKNLSFAGFLRLLLPPSSLDRIHLSTSCCYLQLPTLFAFWPSLTDWLVLLCLPCHAFQIYSSRPEFIFFFWIFGNRPVGPGQGGAKQRGEGGSHWTKFPPERYSPGDVSLCPVRTYPSYRTTGRGRLTKLFVQDLDLTHTDCFGAKLEGKGASHAVLGISVVCRLFPNCGRETRLV